MLVGIFYNKGFTCLGYGSGNAFTHFQPDHGFYFFTYLAQSDLKHQLIRLFVHQQQTTGISIHDLFGNIHDRVKQMGEVQLGIDKGGNFVAGLQLIDPLFQLGQSRVWRRQYVFMFVHSGPLPWEGEFQRTPLFQSTRSGHECQG